ncbi:hypothetical protein JGH11_12630 [Dysgonomonas sp. Marseille-P4677]|uniref:hypothetical protein n=1 Tax=Dysgonomonas sp. Marseille-P4677 TaxID=2364790 RepID=UPI0019146646|nr:hypothetical protein [Dysgonomonas sp. Marseille-P4677]MBK5721717.1 hypothetical protein [Dysgonomonas sp. Marseille-P4677]
MRTIFFVILLTCITVISYAQENKRVIKHNIERNKNIDTKIGYNYFMLEMVGDLDVIYTEYEELVQSVWDKKINLDLKNSSAASIKKIDALRKAIIEMPVYKGGDDYQKSVLIYSDVVKKKITTLEKYGVLGADPNSDTREYSEAKIAFDEVTNLEIEKRNAVRRMKDAYEKTVYVESK